MTRMVQFSATWSLVMLLATSVVAGKKTKITKPKLSVRTQMVYAKGSRQQRLTVELKGTGQFEIVSLSLYKLKNATSGVYEVNKKVLGKVNLKDKEWRKLVNLPYEHGNQKLSDSLIIVTGNKTFLTWGTSPLFLGSAEKLHKLASGALVDSKGVVVTDFNDKKEYEDKLLRALGDRQLKKMKRKHLKDEVVEHNKQDLDLSLAGLRKAPTMVTIDSDSLKMRAYAEKVLGNTLANKEGRGITLTIVVHTKSTYTTFPKTITCSGLFGLYGEKVWRTSRFKVSYPADRPGCMAITVNNVPEWSSDKPIDIVLRLKGKGVQNYLLKRTAVKLEESI